MKKLSKEQIIERCISIHGTKYDYSLVEYINCKTKIKIRCSIHGVFEQDLLVHLKTHGCPSCGREVLSQFHRLNTQQFVEICTQVHGSQYDYTYVEYINNKIKVTIICRKHGPYKQRPNDHQQGYGCPKCGKEQQVKSQTSTTEQFIHKATKIHGTRYDYSLVEYKDSRTKIKIICSVHGIFEQRPNSHLGRMGCIKCTHVVKKDTEMFVNQANNVHNNKYDYSLVSYIGAHKKVKILCPVHGMFTQNPASHLQGHGCKYCNLLGGYDEDYFNTYPEKRHIPALLYVVLLIYQSTFIKIGITVQSLQERFRDPTYKLKEILYVEEIPLYQAFQKEQRVLYALNKFRYKVNKIIDGWTECFPLTAKEHVIIQMLNR